MKKRDVLRGLFLFLLILDMAVIFWFSSQTGEQSADVGNSLTVSLLNIFYCGFNSLQPAARQQAIESAAEVIRMLAHFGVFFLMGIFVCAFYNTYDINKKKLYSHTFLFCLAYAITDEIHQLFVPGRAFEIIDIITDALGVLAGIAAFILINKLIKYYRRKRLKRQ